jgi:quinol monooxygenase YgiN
MANASQTGFGLSPDHPAFRSVPDSAVCVVATVRAKPGSEKQIAAVTQKLNEQVPAADYGCLLFEAHQAVIPPGEIVFYEIYPDMAGFDAHHTADWFQAIADLSVGPVEVRLMKRLG